MCLPKWLKARDSAVTTHGRRITVSLASVPTAGTVLWVGSITTGFQSESPLHPAAAALLRGGLHSGLGRSKQDPSTLTQDRATP